MNIEFWKRRPGFTLLGITGITINHHILMRIAHVQSVLIFIIKKRMKDERTFGFKPYERLMAT